MYYPVIFGLRHFMRDRPGFELGGASKSLTPARINWIFWYFFSICFCCTCPLNTHTASHLHYNEL